MQYIKGGFSFRLKNKMDVWERGFNEHRIVDAGDYRQHVSYIEQNPVRAALVERAAEFNYSSASGRHAVDPTPGHFV